MVSPSTPRQQLSVRDTDSGAIDKYELFMLICHLMAKLGEPCRPDHMSYLQAT